MSVNHNHYMQEALRLAEQGRYTVSPNPMVGCVIVKDNQIVGTGFHKQAGTPHAEIHALAEAKENPSPLSPCPGILNPTPKGCSVISSKLRAANSSRPA